MVGRTLTRDAAALLLLLLGFPVIVRANRQAASSTTSSTTTTTTTTSTTSPSPDDRCIYRAPDANFWWQDGYSGMDALMRESWTDPGGASDGKHTLFYAYGPLFRGRDQIAAWMYNDTGKIIRQWWSKPHCMGITADGCGSHQLGSVRGNEPTAMAYLLNPSMTLIPGGFQYDKTFEVGQKIDTPAGTMELVQDGSKFRLQMNDCYLDHIYVCAKSNYIPMLKNKTGGECLNQMFTNALGDDDCRDHSSFCSLWAMQGRCVTNKASVAALCAASCRICEPLPADDLFAFWNVDAMIYKDMFTLAVPSSTMRKNIGFATKVAAAVGVCFFLLCCWRCCCKGRFTRAA